MKWYLSVLKKYAVFSGRSQRAEFWYFLLFHLIIFIILNIFDNIFGTFIRIRIDYQVYRYGILSNVYSLALLIPSLAVGARRLHDIGKSGWWQLLGFIPIIGGIILIVWFATDSKEDNKYGKNPKGNNGGNVINDNSIDQLEKLADLKEKGVITEEEFNSKKIELLK